MAFSGALTLTDLNDFITPSQACIKPVEQTNRPEEKDPGAASTQIQVDSSGSYYEVASDGAKQAGRKLETAQISLNDCLACSGCITSAESVLITLQSHTEVLNFLNSNPPRSFPAHKVPVLSISPQSLASLAASVSSSSSHPVDLSDILHRVRVFCKEVLGFEHVFDTTFARHIALLEHAREFQERKRGQGKLPMLASACPGWICYAEKTHAEMLPFISQTKSPQQVMGTLVKQWMGGKWGKKPDQIYHVTVMPCYDKKLEASRQDFYNEQYATRDVDCVITTGELELLMCEKNWDLSMAVGGEKRARGASPVPRRAPPAVPTPGPGDGDDEIEIELPELIAHPGTSSGSYLQSVISMAGDASSCGLAVRTVRGADYEEHTVADRASGAVLLRGAKCYGFRNLQNVVRKVGRDAGVQVGRGAAGRIAAVRARGRARKTGADGAALSADRGYDYVEVMACPGGCVNGGGQLRPPIQNTDAEGYPRDWARNGVKLDEEGEASAPGPKANWGSKEWTKKVEEAYWGGLPTPPPTPPNAEPGELNGRSLRPSEYADRLATRILAELCSPAPVMAPTAGWCSTMDDAAEERRRKFFRTQYRAVESEVVGLAVKW
ncbi:iron hydrogenase [Daedalea quercina L-15889]|uniref:Cytosolic Fe-S cluster assembly factor NAR1 n=1 Tax=Daedalea quercina L-15889 TaxID=1314783 RepID=A0A165RQD7_9APHY|nr:iron hydrogenase [Daedalea quercina L-15889]